MKRIFKCIAVLLLLTAKWLSVASQPLPLDSCIRYTLEHNKALLARTKNRTIESYKRKTTQLALYPDVQFTSGVDYYWKIPVQMFPAEIIGGQAGSFIPIRLGLPYTGNYGITADANLVDVEKWQRVKLALLQEKLANASVQSYARELIKNVKLSYYQVLLLQRSVALSDSLYRNYVQINTLIQQKYDEGIADKITVNQSANILSERLDRLIKAKTQLEVAFLNLKVWMGYPFDKALSISEENTHIPGYAHFEENRLPALEVEQLKVENAYRLMKAASNSWYPRLKLQAGYTKTGYSEQLGFAPGFDWFPSGYLGLKLQFPLSAFYRMGAQVQEHKAAWEQSKIHYQLYVEQAQKDFYEQKALAAQYEAILHNNEKAIERARESERLTLQKLQDNIIDMTQIKQASDDLYRLQELYNNNRLNYISAAIQMEYLQHKNSSNEQ
ncbi:TolC family protein [Haoranjiania flava]|uniref:TolC family protein n=1 Tax=Haoranjiania flava TaxID=1856322 RepID=A0AAE3IN95_9BACT|nr:TolC family protein [Haoranjiania flava]MCU7694205.1 TolC family protein [Haoranjiania flava]